MYRLVESWFAQLHKQNSNKIRINIIEIRTFFGIFVNKISKMHKGRKRILDENPLPIWKKY